GETAAHAVLVGMHDDRVVVVDEERAQWRVDVVGGEMPADIVDIESAGAGGKQIGPLQLGRGLGKGVACPEDDTAAFPQLPEQCRQCDLRANSAAAVASAFEPIA